MNCLQIGLFECFWNDIVLYNMEFKIILITTYMYMDVDLIINVKYVFLWNLNGMKNNCCGFFILFNFLISVDKCETSIMKDDDMNKIKKLICIIINKYLR